MINHTNAPPFYARGTCAVCGATTYLEAETRCKTSRDISDEAVCSGGAADECEPSVPSDGFLYFISSTYVTWLDRQIASQEAQP